MKKTCYPKKSLDACKRCLSDDQCKVGFCCSWTKKCIDGKTQCYGSIADCQPRCEDYMDPKDCTCKNKDFPEKWARPTCPGRLFCTYIHMLY